MFIKNVTLADDSLYGALGSYECHAFAVGDAVVSRRHGFSVSVITSTTCNLSFFTLLSGRLEITGDKRRPDGPFDPNADFTLYLVVIYDFLSLKETKPSGKCFFPFNQY